MRARHLLCVAILACDTVDGGLTDDPTIPDADATVADSTPPEDAEDTSPPDTATTTTDTGEDLETAEPDAVEEVADSADDTSDVPPPPPPEAYLTIAAVPPEMNGSRPTVTPNGEISFRLRANRARVDLDLIALPESGPFVAADVELSCTAAGEPHSLPLPVDVGPGHVRVPVGAEHAFPDGAAVACRATVTTAAGSAEATYEFDAATLPPELDPFFETDVWLVQLVRDVWALDVTELEDGTTELLSVYTPDGDGVDDFDAPFFELGFFPESDPEKTALIRAHLMSHVRRTAYAIYGLDEMGAPTPDGVNLQLFFEGDPGAPSPADFATAERPFSMIALTGDGDPEDQLGGTFGRALIDWNNQDHEDDTRFGLGVWPAAVARAILGNPAGAFLLADLRPELGGTPFGLAEGDEHFIGQDVDPATVPSAYRQRASRYDLLIRFGSLALAAILTHEIGHSIGLVAFDPPPEGLFAGVRADWMASHAPDAHIDTEGLNVMQTGSSVNWLEAATGDLPRFAPLCWAYLRRQIVIGRD